MRGTLKTWANSSFYGGKPKVLMSLPRILELQSRTESLSSNSQPHHSIIWVLHSVGLGGRFLHAGKTKQQNSPNETNSNASLVL